MLSSAASVDVWRFQIHPEVWLLVGSLIGLYTYAVRVIGPKVVPEGEPVLTRRQLIAAVSGIFLLWVASDWPMHDIGEQYLYAVHMLQHSLLTLAVPALALVATPRWLADLILGQGKVRRVVRLASLPVVAGVAYNAMVMAVHWPALVNASVENGLLHYGVHTMLVLTSLMMFMPVCGPISEWRISPPAQMIYLFLMSVIPTVPGGWLTFADHAVYSAYDTPFRAFDISVRSDQQAAGRADEARRRRGPVGGHHHHVLRVGLQGPARGGGARSPRPGGGAPAGWWRHGCGRGSAADLRRGVAGLRRDLPGARAPRPPASLTVPS